MLERVLIVEADVRVREYLYEVVTDAGCAAVTLPSGKEALEWLKNERPALIFIEDTPGEYSGILLAKKVREFDKEIKIALLGFNPRPETFGEMLREAGIAAYLKKDLQHPEEIRRLVIELENSVARADAALHRGPSILIVDDELEIRQMVGNFLARRGFRVQAASSGEEGIQKIKLENFDVVLLDITMTGMDGLLMLKRIRDAKTATRVVMATALHNKEVMEQALRLGAAEYIVKPFNLDRLERVIWSVLPGPKDS